MTVTQVSTLVRGILTEHAPTKIAVVGEISNLSARSHWFFSLKDDGASLRCVCFASVARRVNFNPADGMEVVATGRLDYYDATGQLQFYVDRIEPVGLGELERRYRALCDELRQAGYFELDRKKQLPVMPRRIAVVTSRSAAALQDVINTAAKRWPGCRLYLMDVRVQGASAAPEIAAALEALSQDGPNLGIDAVILTRGGGSIEDLWAFNERQVAEAIYHCRLPIVAAIGHETDTTIAELVADMRCATPTQAAMTLIPDQAALCQQIDHLHRRIQSLTMRQLQIAQQRLEHAARHRLFRRPEHLLDPVRERLNQNAARLTAGVQRRVVAARDHLDRLSRYRLFTQPAQFFAAAGQRLDQAQRQLSSLMQQRLHASQERLAALERHLRSVGPQNVLARGFSYTLDADGTLLRSVKQAAPGRAITTVLADGKVHSRIEGDAGPGASPPTSPKVPAPRRRGRKANEPEGPGLFE